MTETNFIRGTKEKRNLLTGRLLGISAGAFFLFGALSMGSISSSVSPMRSEKKVTMHIKQSTAEPTKKAKRATFLRKWLPGQISTSFRNRSLRIFCLYHRKSFIKWDIFILPFPFHPVYSIIVSILSNYIANMKQKTLCVSLSRSFFSSLSSSLLFFFFFFVASHNNSREEISHTPKQNQHTYSRLLPPPHTHNNNKNNAKKKQMMRDDDANPSRSFLEELSLIVSSRVELKINYYFKL
jgi:hypothetical protein